MASIAIIPATRRWRAYLEHEAIRIFGGLSGSTRTKVSSRLLADALSIGAPPPVAKADVADAMEFLDARIRLYQQARDADPFPSRRGRVG